jgi:hypothetical protein
MKTIREIKEASSLVVTSVVLSNSESMGCSLATQVILCVIGGFYVGLVLRNIVGRVKEFVQIIKKL